MSARALSRLAVALVWGTGVGIMALEERLSPQLVDSFGWFIGANLVSLACMLLWVESDAVARGYTIEKWLRFVVVLVCIVGIPTYVIMSRGFVGFLKWCGWLALCSFAAAVVYALTLFLMGELSP